MTGKEVRLTFRGVDKTRAAFGRIKKSFKDIDKLSSKVTRGFGGIGMAIGAAFGTRAIKQIIDTGDQIGKLSSRLGATTEGLSELKYVAEMSGVQFNSLSTGLQRMTRRVSEAASGTGTAKNALKELGLSALDLKNLKPEEQFELIAEALSKVENQSDKVRLAMKLFDTEGVALLQTMENGAEGIKKMREEARKLGVSLSEEDTKAMAEFNDAITKLQVTLTGLMTSVLIPLLPYITAFFDAIGQGGPLINILIAAVTALLALRLVTWFASAVAAIRTFSLILAASPIGLVVTAVSLLVAGLMSLTSWFYNSSDAAKKHSKVLEETTNVQKKLVDKETIEAMNNQQQMHQNYKNILEETKAPMEKHLQQRKELNKLTQEQAVSQEVLTDSIDNTTSKMQETADIQEKLFTNIKQSAIDAGSQLLTHFTSSITGVKGEVKSLKDIFNELFDSIAQGIVNTLTGGMSLQQGLGSIFGGFGNSGGGGLSSFFGGFFAKGGTVKPGKLNVVGDGGEPELFIPNSVGSIIPASKVAASGYGGDIVVNMSVTTPDLASFNYSRGQLTADMARQIAMARRNL